jgi:hypothetical protein
MPRVKVEIGHEVIESDSSFVEGGGLIWNIPFLLMTEPTYHNHFNLDLQF